MSDWYTQEMQMMKRGNALNKLVRVFEDGNVDLKPLASQIKKLARKYKGYQQKSKVKDVTPETPVEVKIVTPEAKSTKTSCRADPCTNRTSFPNAQRSQPQSRVQPSSVQPKPTVRQQFTAFILCCFCFLPQIVGIIISLFLFESLMMNKGMDEMMIGRGGNWIIDGLWRPHGPGSGAKKKNSHGGTLGCSIGKAIGLVYRWTT